MCGFCTRCPESTSRSRFSSRAGSTCCSARDRRPRYCAISVSWCTETTPTWGRIVRLMGRLFAIDLEDRTETVRGGIQSGSQEYGRSRSLAGRGERRGAGLAADASHPRIHPFPSSECAPHRRTRRAPRDSPTEAGLHPAPPSRRRERLAGGHRDPFRSRIREAVRDNLTLLLQGAVHDLSHKTLFSTPSGTTARNIMSGPVRADMCSTSKGGQTSTSFTSWRRNCNTRRRTFGKGKRDQCIL